MKAFNLLTDSQLETLGRLRYKNQNLHFPMYSNHSFALASLKIHKKFFDGNGDLESVSFLAKPIEFAEQLVHMGLDQFSVNEIVALHDFGLIENMVNELKK